MQTGAPVGIILASLVGGFAAPAIGWRASFFVSILPALLVVYIRNRLPESDVWLERKRLIGTPEKPTEAIDFEHRSKFLLLFSNVYRKTFLKSLVLALFDMSAYWFTYSWMPGYLHLQRGLTLSKSAAWILITQGEHFSAIFPSAWLRTGLEEGRPFPSIRLSWHPDW